MAFSGIKSHPQGVFIPICSNRWSNSYTGLKNSIVNLPAPSGLVRVRVRALLQEYDNGEGFPAKCRIALLWVQLCLYIVVDYFLPPAHAALSWCTLNDEFASFLEHLSSFFEPGGETFICRVRQPSNIGGGFFCSSVQ